MAFEAFIAKRYFRAKRKTGFISIITFVSIAGVTIGVIFLGAFAVLVLETGSDEASWAENRRADIVYKNE